MDAPHTWHPNRTGVFLIHGLTGSPTELAPLDKLFRRAGYQTAVPLMAGHGVGHTELLATTWQDWRDGLRRELRELARTCDEVVIVGLCVGGLLGLLLAGEEEKVQGLVSLAPDLGFRVPGPSMPWTRFLLPLALHVPWLRRHGYWTQRPPYGLKNPRLQQRIAKAVAASIRGQTKEYGTFRTYVGTMRELRRLQRVAIDALARVRCPTLMIHSFEDSLFSIRNVTVMYRGLTSPQREIVLITGCDHVLTVDLRKDEVARRIGQFLTGRHGGATEHQDADDEFLACEISPGPQTRVHNLVVRKGAVVRLFLPLLEDTGAPQGGGWSQPPHGDGTLQAEWQLARTAIDALAFGLKKRLLIQANRRINAPATSTSGIEPVGRHLQTT